MEDKENEIPIVNEEVDEWAAAAPPAGGRNPLMEEEEVKSHYCEHCMKIVINVWGSECVVCGHAPPPVAAAGDGKDQNIGQLTPKKRGYQEMGIVKEGKVEENQDHIPAVQFTRVKIDGLKDEKGKAKVAFQDHIPAVQFRREKIDGRKDEKGKTKAGNQDQITAVQFPIDGLKEGKWKAKVENGDHIAAVQSPREKIDGQKKEKEGWERGEYKCETCRKSFPSRKSLGGHVSQHTRKNKLTIINTNYRAPPPPPEEKSIIESIVVADASSATSASAADYPAFDLNMPVPAEEDGDEDPATAVLDLNIARAEKGAEDSEN